MDHEIRYDASKGGRTFVDPDGDPLTYTVTVESWGIAAAADPWIERSPPLPMTGFIRGSIVASDGRGGEATDTLDILVEPNLRPVVSRPNGALVTVLGGHVNRDLTQGGLTFTEPNNDPLTYAVEMLTPAGSGITDDGERVVGALAASIAAFCITANDGHGFSASDTFVIAAPQPLPGKPILPPVPYRYADTDLPLPHEFRRSSETLVPFWDTSITQGAPVTNAGATLWSGASWMTIRLPTQMAVARATAITPPINTVFPWRAMSLGAKNWHRVLGINLDGSASAIVTRGT